MGGFKDHFSTDAEAYRICRPSYPPELFSFLAGVLPRRETALDCGCGSGQASVMLAPHFAWVTAIDPSSEQIAQAMPMQNIDYRVAPAETTGLPEGSVDLAIAGQALHWFDFDRFYPEMKRVVRRTGGAFAAFTYGLIRLGGEADLALAKFYYDRLGAYWPPERRYVDHGYRTIPFPFPEIPAPAFTIAERWDRRRLLGYLATWSAVKECRQKTGADPIPEIEQELARVWDETTLREVRWPLVLRVGRVNGG